MSSTAPYYRRTRPSPKLGESKFAGGGSRIDLSDPAVHLPAFGGPDRVSMAVAQFDDRAAAVMRAAVGSRSLDTYWPGQDILNLVDAGLMEHRGYSESGSGPVNYPTIRCLAILAYADYFTPAGEKARSAVSEAIMLSNPGWCGTFGPVADGATDFLLGSNDEGNYDLAQMHLLPMAYRHYDDLTPDAQEQLIVSLLARGTIHGPNQDDTHTSGSYPEYWSRAGEISPLGYKKRIGETENHILMIMTARYLSNQLMYQRDPSILFDNRRNSAMAVIAETFRGILIKLGIKPPPAAAQKAPVAGSCTFLVLDLLQRILRDDFSEYNSKNYQRETRNALLNLCSYAYDHEVRLAARMVLDYLSAHFAVSSNDLRRMLPFRRLNVDNKVARDPKGFMTCGILEWQDGADSMAQTFAILAGNVRAYETLAPEPGRDPTSWSIRDGGGDQVMDVLSDYRLPPAIHDLFVNDLHRRFHQRLHRYVRSDNDEVGGARNSDNMEIYAGSPSYLITAGGAPADYALDPYFLGVARGHAEKQLGVAVTTSFMPTTYVDRATKAEDLIQFSYFCDAPGITANYGVAPDFACGHQLRLPGWVDRLRGTPGLVVDGNFTFVNKGSLAIGHLGPGFFLAIYQENGLAFLEAFDTWLHPGLSFGAFQADVKRRNPAIRLQNAVPCHYTTWNGNQLEFQVSVAVNTDTDVVYAGAGVINITYGDRDPLDSFGDAGNVQDKFLNGTVMNSTSDATVEITNHFVGSHGARILLDMSDLLHPRRILENGKVEQAGFDNEIWLDFEWSGPSQGDAFQPLKTLAVAMSTVAGDGVIKIIPGSSRERITIGGGRRMTLDAPIGGVSIGVRPSEVWVDFGWAGASDGSASFPFKTIAAAVSEVAYGGRVKILPGRTGARPTIGRKKITIAAPDGDVVIGAR